MRAAPDVRQTVVVIPLEALSQRALAASAARLVVVDATHGDVVSVVTLARLVRLRRVVRARGGELIVAADASTVDVLRHAGLQFALPHRAGVAAAVDALTQSA